MLLDNQGPMTTIESFHPSHISFCSMHSVNLGYALWVSASTLVLLVEQFRVWGGDEVEMSDRYKSAWLHFNGWSVSHKIQQLRNQIKMMYFSTFSWPNLYMALGEPWNHWTHNTHKAEAFPGHIFSEMLLQCTRRTCRTPCKSVECFLAPTSHHPVSWFWPASPCFISSVACKPVQARVVVGWLSDVMVRYSQEFPRGEGLDDDGFDPYHVANCVQLGHKQCVQLYKCHIKIQHTLFWCYQISTYIFLCNRRYYLGEWFNLVESHGRYLDDQPIHLTSEACETWVCNHIREKMRSETDFYPSGSPPSKNLGPNIEFLLPAGWAGQRLGDPTLPNQTEVPRALFSGSCVAMFRACAKLTECDVFALVLGYWGVSRAAICTLQIWWLVFKMSYKMSICLLNTSIRCDAGFGFGSAQASTAAFGIVLPKRISTVSLFA